MLTKVIFNRIQELYQRKFSSEDLIILPSTAELDHWKSIFPQNNLLTYSQWLKFECGENSGHLQRSELWIHLFRLWKNCDGREHYQTFESVFQLFTELRSVTDDGDVFEEVLKIEFPLIEENIRFALKAFFVHPLIQDENAHLETILAKDEKLQYKIIHWIGFQSFSNKQIAFLNNSKTINDHYIYIPKLVDHCCQNNNGWSLWLNYDQELKNEKIIIEVGGGKSNCILNSEVVDEIDFENIIRNYKTAKFIKPYELISQIQNVKKNGKGINFLSVHPLSNQSLYQQYLGSSDWSFHQSSNIWESTFDQIEMQLSVEINKNITHHDLKFFFEKIKNKFRFQFIKEKIIQVFINELTSLSFGQEQLFTTLDFMVIKQKILWDLPRLYWNASSNKNKEFQGHLFQDIQNTHPPRFEIKDELRIIYIENDYVNDQNNGTKFDDQTVTYLTTFSPLFGKKIKQAWIEQKIIEWLDSNKTLLIVNEELKTTSAFWSKFQFEFQSFIQLKSLNEIRKDDESTKSSLKIIPLKKSKLQYFSPTAIKTYQECPRKYHWQYIEGDRISPDVLPFLTEMDRGNILHKLMEVLTKDKIKNDRKIEFQDCLNEVQKQLQNYNNKIHDDFDRKSDSSVLVNTLLECFEDWKEFPFLKKIKDWELFWEMDFYHDSLRLKGRGDFFAININEKSLFVLDFKKGSSSIPTQKEFKNGEALQVYASLIGFLNAKMKLDEIDLKDWTWTIGYYCLSDPKESLLASSSLNEINQHKIIHFTDDLRSLTEKFEGRWMYYASLIDQDVDFKPSPKSQDICHYCDHRFLCERGNLGN